MLDVAKVALLGAILGATIAGSMALERRLVRIIDLLETQNNMLFLENEELEEVTEY